MERRSRWDDSPKLTENGKPIFVRATATDMDIFKLLAPTAGTRSPWAYRVLPSNYFADLLGRGKENILDRLADLSRKPHQYLVRPEQPHNNYRPLIYTLGKRGADELRNEGMTVPWKFPRQLPHTLMSCMIAASFEYGCARHNLRIEPGENHTDIIPDWPVFRIDGHTYFIEADTRSESLTSSDDTTKTIQDKFERYLAAIAADVIRRPRVMFITTGLTRVDSMIRLLRKTIDTHHYPFSYADHFCFKVIKYDRFLSSIPKLTDWAITEDWRRAHKERPTFNIRQEAAKIAA
jgi:hypothetical protein